MVNEYALSTLHWFFLFCLLHNGFKNFTLFPSRSLSENVLSFVTAELRAQQSYVHRELFHLVYTCWGFAQAFIFRNISRKGRTAVNSDELRILIISHKACRIRDSHECSKNWFLYLCPARNKLMCVLMCIKS